MSPELPIDSNDDQQKLLSQIKKSLAEAKATSVEAYKAAILSVQSMSVPSSVMAEVQKLAEAAQKELDQRESAISGQARTIEEAQEKQAAQAQAQKLEEQRVDQIYSKFDSFHDDYLQKQKSHNKNLDEALKAVESGRDISEELEKKLVKTPKEEAEEEERWGHTLRTEQEALKEHAHCSTHLAKIHQDISALHPDDHATRKNLHQHKSHFEQRLNGALGKLKQVGEHRNEVEHYHAALHKGISASKEHNNQRNADVLERLRARYVKKYGEMGKQQVAPQKKQEEFIYQPSYAMNYHTEVREPVGKYINNSLSPTLKAQLRQEPDGHSQQVVKNQISVDKPSFTPIASKVEQGKGKGRW